MFVSPPLSKTLHQVSASSSCLVRWQDFDLRVGKLSASIIKGNVDNQVLHDTQLSCTIDSMAGQWEHRKIFIENIVADTIEKCPKNETLVLISFGSDRLLTEYILGKTLIENGFNQISFFLIDPVYLFSSSENLVAIQQILKDFRSNIESVFFKINKENFGLERIRFLSRSHNIAKYFPSGANVLVIESLPPYAEIIETMKKNQVAVKSAQDLIIGGRFVKPNQANTIAFVPKQYVNNLSASGAKLTDSLPLAIFKCEGANFYLDWGCKIRGDGTYSLSFSGEEYYLKSVGVSPDKLIKLEKTGEVIQARKWISIIRKNIETTLSKNIENIKGTDCQKELSQENLAMLLEKVQAVVTLYMPGISCFYSADYVLDRDASLMFLSTHAGHHYRKSFSLLADADSDYKIFVKEIE